MGGTGAWFLRARRGGDMGTCPLGLMELCRLVLSTARLAGCSHNAHALPCAERGMRGGRGGEKGGDRPSGSSDSSPYCFSLSRLLLTPGRNMCLAGRFPAPRIGGKGQGAPGGCPRHARPCAMRVQGAEGHRPPWGPQTPAGASAAPLSIIPRGSAGTEGAEPVEEWR